MRNRGNPKAAPNRTSLYAACLHDRQRPSFSRAATLEAEPVELDAIDARVLRDRDQLANERKEAKKRRRSVRGWIVVMSRLRSSEPAAYARAL